MKTFVSKQFLAKSGIALIIGAVLVGAIVFHTAELKNRLNRTQASWSAFSETDVHIQNRSHDTAHPS